MSNRTDPTAWMWSQAVDMLDQVERMHRQFFRLSASPRAQLRWEPPVDVFEDGRDLVIVVALPGVVAERVEVAVDAGTLLVRAERPLPFAGTCHQIQQLEIPYGIFERRIPLPETPFHSVSHELTHGCLVVRLSQ